MSTSRFPVFARLVAESFQTIVKSERAFVVCVDGDAMFAAYLAGFPEGTNPIFKTTTEHDCHCCRNFVRRVGGVVSLLDGVVRTIWDQAAESAPAPYREVAARMKDLVLSASIQDIFCIGQGEDEFGSVHTRSMDSSTQRAITWDHFYTGKIPWNLRVSAPGEMIGNYRTTTQVFERGLVELTPEAVETVVSLVGSNSLYRGEEHGPALTQFQRMQREFLAKTDAREKSLFVWENAGSPAARFRNTAIGTLVQDLSEGRDIENAVRSFESKVGAGYKRTTALITPGMVKKAMETIEALGLESALERRFAVISDVSINDVKWVDNGTRPLMKGGIGAVLMQHAVSQTPAKSDGYTDISLEAFMSDVLPTATSIEVMFRGELAGNLMSLTAPCHPEPKQLFRWTNDFAWSYGGNVTDSIKERVKRAGGRVDGVLRVSLSWFNYDDLDLHVYEPAGRGARALTDHIHFRNKRGWTGGVLDVDMNAGTGTTREPVENVTWAVKPPDGSYRVVVNNYRMRETSNPGFVVEVESAGKVFHYSYSKAVRDQQDIGVVTMQVKNGVIERIDVVDPGITASSRSQDKWGLRTEQWCRVSAVMLSPNYWGDNAVGNRHTFFMLEGAKNDEPTRGFYNEFLHPRLEPHRKVFEVIADKTKCQPTEGQLSGLGFSSTKKESFQARVLIGNKQRVFNIHVGGKPTESSTHV